MPSHSISPPPLKRQKQHHRQPSSSPQPSRTTPITSHSACQSPSSKKGALRIFSWNINGITPFIAPYLQKPISSYFSPSSKKRGREETPPSSPTAAAAEDDDETKEGPPSLRHFLHRHHWPRVLFLQEVKIKPGDTATMKAVQLALNDPITPSPSPLPPQSPSSSETTPKEASFLSDGGPLYTVHLNLPHDPHNAKGFGGKVYGVATIIRRDFHEKYVKTIRDVDWDLEGRVSVVETGDICFPITGEKIGEGKSEGESDNPSSSSSPTPTPTKLALINIYAVNGTQNPYHGPNGSVVGTRHTHKLALHRHLFHESLHLESQGFHVIIAGDMNIARSRIDGHPNLRVWPEQHCVNREDFNTLFFRKGGGAERDRAEERKQEEEGEEGLCMNAIDTFRYIHGSNKRGYSYYPRGREWGSSCDRVDMIITSQALRNNVVDAGICENQRGRGPSDHCPVWVDLG